MRACNNLEPIAVVEASDGAGVMEGADRNKDVDLSNADDDDDVEEAVVDVDSDNDNDEGTTSLIVDMNTIFLPASTLASASKEISVES